MIRLANYAIFLGNLIRKIAFLLCYFSSILGDCNTSKR